MHGGVAKADLATENVQAIDGLPNLTNTWPTSKKSMVHLWLAINKFLPDTEAELEAVYESCKKRNVDVVISNVWAKAELWSTSAEKVIQLVKKKPLLLCL